MNLLITGAWADAKTHPRAIEDQGHSVAFIQMENDELPCAPEWVEGVVCNGLFLYHPITDFPNLRFIQLTSAGFDRVPMDYVQSHGIEIHNARGVYSAPMAEFAVGSVLQIYKQFPFFRENQKAHRWEKRRDLRELTGKTVVILGCGSVGTECAKRFRVFACKLIGVDIYPRQDERFDEILPLTALDETLPAADVLILTVPLTDETRGLINAARLAAMKPDAVLVNISRGAVIDEPALLARLRTTPAFTAALDVFEEEPIAPNSPLWTFPNVYITPHNCFSGENNSLRLNKLIVNRIVATGL
jgi:phosphoglycerate dehydrogenase-like enzyme